MENPYILIMVGLLFLFGGGEFLLRSAVQIAQKLKISERVIGLTIMGFGTSLPELLVSVEAGLAGKPDIALGNVIGSNTANILLIGGLSATIMPVLIKDQAIKRDAMIALAASILLYFILLAGNISILQSLMLLSLLFAYLVYSYKVSGTAEKTSEVEISNRGFALATVYLCIGFVGLFIGANWLVSGSSTLARQAGVSEAAIGLTIVAVGTSLPELAASFISAIRGKSDVAIANIIGSNIFNILAILGITGLITPIAPSWNFVVYDAPVMLAATAGFALVMIFLKGIPRPLAIIMLILYITYIWKTFA
jgi:cation:H+ antiporter